MSGLQGQSLPQRLRLVRRSLRKSQAAMAEMAGISTTGWQAYEHGKHIPGGDIIARLVVLGVDANWLLLGEGEMHRRGAAKDAARQNTLAPFLAAARTGVKVREAVAAHRRAASADDIEGGEVSLGLIAATRELCWADFASLLAAWEDAQ